MPYVTTLIKPASGNCNLKCKYCFYEDIKQIRSTQNFGYMSRETAETLIKKVFEYAEGGVSFAFQGGEPTLIGLDFYKYFVETVKKFNKDYLKVSYAIQTNGTLIDDEWAKFFRINNFLVGLSIDGFANLHNKNRVTSNEQNTFDAVWNAKEIFDKNKVEYNILSVVTDETAKNTRAVYNFFKKNKLSYLQFIPCLAPLECSNPQLFLSADSYGKFLTELFDLWYVDLMKGNGISIRFFDNLATMAAGYPAESCGMSGSCACYFTIEADGSVYPCDFYVTDDWKLGNVNTHSLSEMIYSDTALAFKKSSEPIDDNCKKCEYFNLCRGGCRRYREPFTEASPSLNHLCGGLKRFFEHSHADFKRIAEKFISNF